LIATYEHFLRLASRIQWDGAAIDLSADAEAWPLDERITELVAGFCVGEAGVAEHLHDFFDGPAAA
jgi:ribonucleoside-diphosphate reductase beta chain